VLLIVGGWLLGDVSLVVCEVILWLSLCRLLTIVCVSLIVNLTMVPCVVSIDSVYDE